MYKIENELPLRFSIFLAGDGNQSLRLIDLAFLAGELRPNDCVLCSGRYLWPEEVDVFKDEVQNVKKAVSVISLLSLLTLTLI